MQDEYVQHIIYDNAFRGSIQSKERTDEIFIALKADLKSHGLKSKDMKKFIEYGWLYQTPEYKTLEEKGKLFENTLFLFVIQMEKKDPLKSLEAHLSNLRTILYLKNIVLN